MAASGRGPAGRWGLRMVLLMVALGLAGSLGMGAVGRGGCFVGQALDPALRRCPQAAGIPPSCACRSSRGRRGGLATTSLSAAGGSGHDGGLDGGEESAPLGVVEAATRFASAVQEERATRLRMDIMNLEKDLEEAKQKQQWESFVQGLEEVGLNLHPGGTPWEPVEEQIKLSGLFSEEEKDDGLLMNGSYIPVTTEPVNLIGSFDGLDEGNVSASLVRKSFDNAILEQKAKEPPKTFWDELTEAWEVADREAEEEMAMEMKLLKRRTLERRIKVLRKLMKMQSDKYARFEHELGDAPLNGHMVPWELVQSRMQALQSQILRDSRYEGVGTAEEKKAWLDNKVNRSAIAMALRMPATQSSSAEGGNSTFHLPASEMVEDADDLLEMLTSSERNALSRIRGDLDIEVKGFKEKQEAIVFGTEELIRDHINWWPENKRPKYDSVDAFRRHVIQICEQGVKEGLNISTMDVPWRDLTTLFMEREEAVKQGIERRRARRAKRPSSLAADGIFEEEIWADVEEQAESEWRFYDPEQYYRYEKLRDHRNQLMKVQKSREETIMAISAEAEVALDEYLGVMLDLGWAERGVTLNSADVDISPISGRGRELGLGADVERQVRRNLVSMWTVIILSPILLGVADFTPGFIERGMRKVESRMALITNTVEMQERVGGTKAMLNRMLFPPADDFY